MTWFEERNKKWLDGDLIFPEAAIGQLKHKYFQSVQLRL